MRQRACDRGALLLAAGQVRRIGVALVEEADPVEDLLGALDRLLARFLQHVDRGLDHIPSTVRCGQRLKLWNTMARLGADALDLPAVEGPQRFARARA